MLGLIDPHHYANRIRFDVYDVVSDSCAVEMLRNTSFRFCEKVNVINLELT